MGADVVVCFDKQDFTEIDTAFDCVFDAVGKSTFGRCQKIMKPGGIYISSELGPGAQNLLFALLSPFMSKYKLIFPVPLDIKGSMHFICKLLVEGKFKPLIDRSFKLEEIVEAYNYTASGKKIGNVLLCMQD